MWVGSRSATHDQPTPGARGTEQLLSRILPVTVVGEIENMTTVAFKVSTLKGTAHYLQLIGQSRSHDQAYCQEGMVCVSVSHREK